MTTLDAVLGLLRASGEETRLRVLTLLAGGELTVSELTQILGQSQPRVSRHMKVLADAGLVERYREGAWVFYRLNDADNAPARVLAPVLAALSGSGDRLIARDGERLRLIHRVRAELASDYFRKNAVDWDKMRKLHLPDSDIEQAMRAVLGPEKIRTFYDLGTGTGRILEVLADLYENGVGFDLSLEMLGVARANLDKAGVSNAQVRQGDLLNLPVTDHSADLIAIHQVLHYLAEPQAAVHSAARLLKPGGRLMIIDFAPHELEFLREEHAHRRLGFADDEVRGWCAGAGLDLARIETLAPKTGSGASKQAGQKLTVKIWLCAAVVKPRARKREGAALK